MNGHWKDYDLVSRVPNVIQHIICLSSVLANQINQKRVCAKKRDDEANGSSESN